MRLAKHSLLALAAAAIVTWTVFAQASGTVTVTRDVNLRPDPSTEYAATRLLKPGEAAMTLIDASPESGYYHVRTSAGEEGYVWAANVHVSTSATPPAGGAPTAPPPPPPNPSMTPTPPPITLGGGIPGSTSMVGCGDDLWQHVYNPTRLLVQQDCVTIPGTIMDATANESAHQPDGVRHEADGDTHGWLKVDAGYENLINAGNASDEGKNLVFELVCHFTVTQTDAKPACAGAITR